MEQLRVRQDFCSLNPEVSIQFLCQKAILWIIAEKKFLMFLKILHFVWITDEHHFYSFWTVNETARGKKLTLGYEQTTSR